MAIDSYHYRAKAAARKHAPLVFAFHGTGGEENQLFGIAEQAAPAAAIIAPRGDVFEHGAARFFRRKAEGVYDFEDLAARTEQMAGFVLAHKQAAGPARTIGLGYSNGANILASVVFDHGGLFDDIVLMHPLIPWMPRDNAQLRPLRVLITAGRRDPICPPAQTTSLADYFLRQGSDVALNWHDGGHELQPRELAAIVDFLKGVAA